MKTDKIAAAVMNSSSKNELFPFLLKESVKNKDFGNIASLFGIPEEDHHLFLQLIEIVKSDLVNKISNKIATDMSASEKKIEENTISRNQNPRAGYKQIRQNTHNRDWKNDRKWIDIFIKAVDEKNADGTFTNYTLGEIAEACERFGMGGFFVAQVSSCFKDLRQGRYSHFGYEAREYDHNPTRAPGQKKY